MALSVIPPLLPQPQQGLPTPLINSIELLIKTNTPLIEARIKKVEGIPPVAQWLSGFGHTAPGRQQATGGAGTGLIKSNTPLIEFNTPLIKSNAPLEELPPQGTKAKGRRQWLWRETVALEWLWSMT